ncbi:isoleucine--tRNA ligase [Candidatus Daviesbacteria bacterium RIFCSPLOWO2_02_FULL_36_7]|uniref:Isoleucine--tRNA ligase n=1 Tax=Candidatus Daviesbacteria bacterium RIFCSPLOWO2_02_FULL_36_7 TaxID=1797792 RepID=A0A1F5MH23_9BACT|nr:MAG: isoleucine--tRNA ligase [Candidatus Daviesbacteria bacterium RIFCSPLOWO2_02_FULL_36_7]
MLKFKPVSSQVDFPALERELLGYWYKEGIVEKYLNKNNSSDKKFSFLDGPITANNPMGVHHAWGRTYKDLWQRFFNMKGYKQRFQNGFDEQGLWVEVEVEKELELHSKKDIENLVPGDRFKSLEKFINLCKDRVKKYSDIQTEQSKRLGYFMDWDNSYHTSADENNYAIWNFIKVVNEKGWLYKGYDSVPWCPRCGTAISQHEILTEDYKEIVHESVYFKLSIKGREKKYLVVWTTTPWTIPANIAVAVDPKQDYVQLKLENGDLIWVMEKRVEALEKLEGLGKLSKGQVVKGKELVGLEYEAPFDHLPRVNKALGGYIHRVVKNDELILPISMEEGTGMVHIATGAGSEDFKLGAKLGLPVIELIDEQANYLDEMEGFSGQNVKKHPEIVINFLKGKESGRFLLTTERIKHRYPICWRCKTELVWRVVDEWYIEMDRDDKSGKTYREQMMEVAKKITWIPKWGLDRELDWLKNMHDWLISKKRYWGLSLPIWLCAKCGNFEVIGSRQELKEKAVEGWEEFDGHTPHRPWIDAIKIKCSKCREIASRIPDVGNPWLDAGIVPFSTMPKEWFPADFVTESFPGQFKNWFYSLIAMSTAISGENPLKNLLGFASLLDEKGEAMHKSKGNAIEFNEGADQIGADIMRWLYVTQNPEANLLFGFTPAAEVKRRFYLILWNSYKFFVDYATVTNWEVIKIGDIKEMGVLDQWILAKLNEVILFVNKKLEKYDVSSASRVLEDFVINDFSTWYIRRSRDRVGLETEETERNIVLSVMHEVLVKLTKLLAPFVPFISESIFQNLTNGQSVHLQDYPEGDKSLLNKDLIRGMMCVRKIAETAHAKRKEAGIKLRQPLASVLYKIPNKLSDELEKVLAEELNVKKVEYSKSSKTEPEVELNTKITPELAEEGQARDLIRQIQQARKEQNLTLADKTKIIAVSWPVAFESQILAGTASISIEKGEQLQVLKIS